MRSNETKTHVGAVAAVLEGYFDHALPRDDVLAMLYLAGLTADDADAVVATGVAQGVFVEREGDLRLRTRCYDFERLAGVR